MNYTNNLFKKHGKINLAMLLILLGCLLGGSAYSKSSVVSKSLTFQAEQWSFLRSPVLRPQMASPVVTPSGILVFSSRKVIKLFDNSGKALKEIKTRFAPSATPAVADGKLYVGGKDGKFHCLDLETGSEVWANDLKSIEFSQAAVFQGVVIFQTAGDRLIALDTAKGEWRWEYQHLRGDELAVAGMCPPLVVDGEVYFGLSAGYIMAMEAVSGRPLWKIRAFTGSKFRDVDAPLAVDAESVFAVSVGGGTVAISRKTGKVTWRSEVGGLGGLCLRDGILYLSSEEPAIAAFDAVTGKQLWKTRLKEKRVRFSDYPLAPVAVKGVVATVTRGGIMIALSAKDGKELEKDYYLMRTVCPPIELADGSGFLVLDNQGMIRVWRVSGN